MDDNDEYFHPVTSQIGQIFGSDSDTIYTILFCVFFLTGVISYLTIFITSVKTRFRTVSEKRLSPPELQVSQQSSPQDKRIPGILPVDRPIDHSAIIPQSIPPSLTRL